MTSVREAPAHERLPAKPPPSAFVIGSSLFAVALTIVTAREVGFSVTGVVDAVTRQNPVVEGLLSPDWSQVTNERTRKLFVETLGLAVLGTLIGAIVSLPFALLSTTYGNPNSVLRAIVRSANGVIRSIPDLLWALLFVTAVGIGTLSGLLALGFFSIAVITKLTADSLEVDRGTFARLAPRIPASVVSVAESGVRGPHDVIEYGRHGANVVLVGETLVRDDDPRASVADLVAAGSHPALQHRS